eukprot:CAMPEP_0184330274 /NCGR_PEP_ID=MMETSP1049-20130417/144596_1 /TAXON_ID=77928 /ORGANISM="Proteomonas sulcata, Strain CCMP704" /LENGTH=218 /DNA_ID=CAMNT_0026652699 /DNA_START=43 /DNA_END=699 /DNA_ORIENTATION=-
MDRAASRFMFHRVVLGAIVAFIFQAVNKHGLPNMQTLGAMWKAIRGNAQQSDVKGIAEFAMDENTHNIFYCSLLLSAVPSLLLLAPVLIPTVTTGSRRAKKLLEKAPMVGPVVTKGASFVLDREEQMLKLSAQCEVLILIVLIVELLTPRRNLLFIILYAQLLRVRHLVNTKSQEAWSAFTAKLDSVFCHQRSPAPVQTAYRKVKSWIASIANPMPKQ